MKKSVLPMMLVAILMVLGLTACGENAGDTQSDMSATTTEQAVAQETAAAKVSGALPTSASVLPPPPLPPTA